MQGIALELFRTLFETINMRSFSNLWYWIGLAALWSSVSYRMLGVPFDMLQRARRHGGQAQADVEAIAAIQARRLLTTTRVAAVPMFFMFGLVFTLMALLAFFYRVEFAQALFFMFGPMSLVGWLTLRTALRVERGENEGQALFRRLLIHRRQVQVVGMCAIFVTAMYGMWRNLNISVLH